MLAMLKLASIEIVIGNTITNMECVTKKDFKPLLGMLLVSHITFHEKTIRPLRWIIETYTLDVVYKRQTLKPRELGKWRGKTLQGEGWFE